MSRRRGPYVAGREAQRIILNAARDVFAERGFRGGALRDVAERAGVSAGNIIHHFGSKQALLIALLEERDIGSNVSPHEPGDGLVELLRDLVRRNAQDRSMVQLFTTLAAESTDAEHPAHDFFRDRYTTVRDTLTANVRTAQQQGALPEGPPAEQIAAGLIAIMDGLQIQWLLDPGFDMVAAFDCHLRVIGALETGSA